MKRSVAILIAALLPFSAVSLGQRPALKFVKMIGVSWRGDKWAWMRFVAFSPDGTKIASDASTAPDDASGNLTLWSFPEGRLIKRLPNMPTGISNDWKYYATLHGVEDVVAGKPVISEVETVYPIYEFSPDSRYVAETLDRRVFTMPQFASWS